MLPEISWTLDGIQLTPKGSRYPPQARRFPSLLLRRVSNFRWQESDLCGVKINSDHVRRSWQSLALPARAAAPTFPSPSHAGLVSSSWLLGLELSYAQGLATSRKMKQARPSESLRCHHGITGPVDDDILYIVWGLAVDIGRSMLI